MAVVNIAHRGGAGDAPENTLAAFDKALRDGLAQWVELDVQRSRDGGLFVVHDDDLVRTSDVARRFPDRQRSPVGDFSAAELRTLDCGSWFDAGRFAGERMPTLDEVLDLVGGKLGVLLEFKSSARYPGIEEQVAAVLHRHGLQASPLLEAWSFDFGVLERFAPLCPAVRRGMFVRDMAQAALPGRATRLHAVGVYPDVTAHDMEIARRHRLEMVASTLNSRARIEAAMGLGIARIVSDLPALLHEVARRVNASPPIQIVRVDDDGAASGTVVLRNRSSHEIDLQGWHLRHGQRTAVPPGPLAPAAELAVPVAWTAREQARRRHRSMVLRDPADEMVDATEF